MCVRPNYILVTKFEYPERMEVPCRECWACRVNRQNDLIGRGMAERAYADGGVFLTLTYDDKKLHEASQKSVIHKEDFQNFMKLWRKWVGTTRYIAAGEYGSKKGRVHFHAVLFTKGYCPVYPYKERFWDDQIWPWGHMWAEPVTMKTIRYVAKYLTKQEETGSDEWVTYSRFPLLGYDFCVETAWRAVQKQVFPTDFNYWPPGYSGKPKLKFSFYGKAQEVILDTIFDLWPEARDLPKTEWMEKAVQRYDKLKHRKAWEGLPAGQQSVYFDEEFEGGLHRPLPFRLDMQSALEQTEMENRWHAEREREGIARRRRGLVAE